MHAELLPILRCPTCGASPLTPHGLLRDDAGEIVAGALRCDGCSTQTAIHDGIWDALGDAPLARSPAQLTNYLSLTARGYEPGWRWLALTLMSGRHFPLREERTLLHELIQPRPGGVYLDVACSAGLYARVLARPGTIVAGIDHSWAFVREAQRKAREHGLRISYIRGLAQHLPLRDGVADGVVMGGSLNELGDQQGALHEVGRVLKRDGRFFCMNLLRAHSGWGARLQSLLATGGIVFPYPADLEQWLFDAGLRMRARWRWRVVLISLLQPYEH